MTEVVEVIRREVVAVITAAPPKVVEVVGGARGLPGEGVPAGGATGTVLTKASGTDFDTLWSPAGGVSDGDKGNIVVSESGAVWAIKPGSITDLMLGASVTALFAAAVHTHPNAIAAGAAGFMTGADKTKLDGITGTNTGDQTSIVGITGTKAQFDAAVTDGNILYVGDPPTAHTHLLAAGATDVTMTAANLNTLDDGLDTTLHFHAADRARASHTGSQLSATISDFSAAVAATAAVTANTAKVTNATHTGDVTGATALTIAALAVTSAKIADDAVGNDKLANMAFGTIKARTTAGSGNPENATGTEVTALLDLATTTLKGLAPARSGVATEYLDGTGAYSTPPGGTGTDLSYTDATRVLASSTGADATLPLMSSGNPGLVPASGGGTANFLRADGTFAAPAGGGGGSPGGASGEVQYNDGGAFAGAADVEIEGGQLRLPAIASPAAPAADGLKLYGRKVGGRMMPAFMGPSGLDSSLQPHLGRNKIGIANPTGNNNTISVLGLLIGSTGTATPANVATTNRHTRMRRLEYLATTAATTAVVGFRNSAVQWTLGASTAGDGGFHMVYRWGPATGVTIATHRAFAGMRGSSAAPTDVEPSSLTNICGMGWDAADANIQFIHNDGSGTATKIDLGASFPVPTVDRTDVYEIALFAPPGTVQSLSYEVTNLTTGAVATGTVTTDLPATSQLLTIWSYMSVGGTSSVVGIAVMGLTIESDY